MANKQIMDITTNRYVYNRTRKVYLESVGKLRCSWCPYHKNENYDGKFYGTCKEDIKYPSWKLVSKNRKQWMKKPIKMVTRQYRNKSLGDYVEIRF